MLRLLCRCLGACGVILAVLVWAAPAAADVSDYGGYYKSFPDFVTTRGLGMRIERLYNSYALSSGIFGYGWGSDYEVKFEVLDDGSVEVHEYGSGADNIFKPTDPAQIRPLDSIIDEITAAAEKVGRFGSESERDAYRTWLVANHLEEWQRFRDLGLVTPKRPGIGQTFISIRFSSQLITRVPEGYQLQDGDTFKLFDFSGRVLQIWNTNHDSISLRYDSRGQLSEIDDNFGNRFLFTFNDAGYVASVTDSNNRTERYAYDGKLMVRSIDPDGKVTAYGYDYGNRMDEIAYPDKTLENIEYAYNRDIGAYTVSSVKDRDGSSTVYTYTNDGADHYSIAWVKNDSTGKKVASQKKEYYYAYDASHFRHLSREIVTIDDKTTDTTYNLADEAITITTNGVTAQLSYDSLGHVIKKQTPLETDQYDYDNVIGKVITYTQTVLPDPAKTPAADAPKTAAGDAPKAGPTVSHSKYEYDPKGTLLRATDNGGDVFSYTWDESGRLASVVDSNGDSLRLSYNALSRPGTIVMEHAGTAIGTMQLTWTPDGTYKSATTDTGDAAQKQILAFFNRAFNLVQPAGIYFW